MTRASRSSPSRIGADGSVYVTAQVKSPKIGAIKTTEIGSTLLRSTHGALLARTTFPSGPARPTRAPHIVSVGVRDFGPAL